MAPHRPVNADRLELIYPAGPPPMDAAPDAAAVVVGGRYTRDVARAYAGTGVEVVTRIDEPGGLGKPTVRQIAAVAAAKDGTDAVELAAPAPLLVAGDHVALRDDLTAVAAAAREVRGAVGVRVALDFALIAGALPAVCAAVQAAGGDAVVWAGPVADAATVRAAAGGLKLVVNCPEADAAGWLAAGADRVGQDRRA